MKFLPLLFCYVRFRAARRALLVLPLLGVASGFAEIVRVDLTKESPTFEGTTFGPVGANEYLIGRAYGELDPALPANQGIVNLDKAPRNSRGRVEYVVDLTILKPVDLTKGNGAILYDVLNRGTKRLLTGRVNGGGAGGEAKLAADVGTGFLMRSGFTMVWSGWQADVKSNPALRRGNNVVAMMAGEFPIAQGVTMALREEFNFDHERQDPTYTPTYPAASVDPKSYTISVRQRAGDPRQSPRDLKVEWVSPTEIKVHRPEGFDAGALYELVYQAKDTTVMGIGFAATRDVMEFLRYSTKTGNPLLVDGKPAISRSIALGISQSGRYLKDFTYQGFNTAESGRIVFEGVMPMVAGSRRTMVNMPFSKPGDFSREHETHLARGDQFPFTYATMTDPISGKTDGIFAPLKGNIPKVMHIDSDTEIFQARASLVVTDPMGKPVTLPDNVRVYFLAGHQHAPSARPNWTISQRPLNPLNYGEITRALIAAMDAWVKDGTVPPASRYPSAADGTLVSPDDKRAGYPVIPGFRYNGLVNVVRLKDESTSAAPTEGPAYTVLVGTRDADGNNIAGIRHPLIEAPLGTHTGWNLRDTGFGYDALNNLDGSFVPFAKTKTERATTKDGRLSLEERYPSVDAWVAKVSAAADRLVADRLLLREDADQIVKDAKTRGFDYFGPIPPKPEKRAAGAGPGE